MATTIQDTIDFSKPFIEYVPLSAGTNFQPAVGIANMVQQTICGAPFCWPWNRAEDSSTSTVIGTQDYTIAITDFGFLETVSLTDANGKTFQLKTTFNTKALAKADSTVKSRPSAAAVQTSIAGTSVTIRFSSSPDAVYQITVEYQKSLAKLTALTGGPGTWLMPDAFMDVFNAMFIAEAYQVVDDARGAQYRQRGAAALLSRAIGLTEMEVNNFLAQYVQNDLQSVAANLKTQQSNNARGI